MSRGISLIELVVVISIVGILAVLGLPPFMEFVSKGRVENEIGMLYENIKWAQTEAEKQGDVAMVNGNLCRRRIFVTIDRNSETYSIWRWQDNNQNGIPEATEFDKDFDTLNPADEPVRREALSKTTIGFDSSVDKKACNNGNGAPSDGIVNLVDCPNVICNGCQCIRFDGKGFIEGLNGGSIYLTNGKYTAAISLGVAGVIEMCKWNGSQWVSMQ